MSLLIAGLVNRRITTFTHEPVEVARVNFRRAGATLSRLKASGRNGAMQTLLPAHGFGVQVNAGLVYR